MPVLSLEIFGFLVCKDMSISEQLSSVFGQWQTISES